MSASATAHIFMLIYSLPLVHRPKGVLLVLGESGHASDGRIARASRFSREH